MLFAGHFFTDINQGALPAILPFLIAEHGLNYAAAATLVFATNFVSSIIQPLFGHLADRISKPWLMPLGIFGAGLGMAFTGLIGEYWLLFVAVLVSGVGIAAFHPEAARLTNKVSGDKKGTGMSFFGVGGNAGIAVGPLVITAALLTWGLKGTLALVVPTTVMALVIWREIKAMQQFQQADAKKPAGAQAAPADDEWGPFSRLALVIFCRSTIFYGCTTFIPLYWIGVFQQSKVAGGTALSVFLFTGTIGTLIGGRLADRFGDRPIIRLGFTALIPVMLLFAFAGNVTMATLLLVPIGLGLYIPFSPTIVLAQKYLPTRMGLASGVTLGLSVSIGGLTTPLLGMVADRYGLEPVMTILACVPFVAALMTYTLPVPGQAARLAAAATAQTDK